MTTSNDSIFNSIQERILIVDKNLNILNANSRMLNSLNLDKQEVIGNPCYRVTKCDLPDGGCPLFEVLKTDKPSTKRCMRPSKNGNEIHMEVTVYPFLDDEENDRFIHVERDVTEHVRAETEVKKYIDTLKKG